MKILYIRHGEKQHTNNSWRFKGKTGSIKRNKDKGDSKEIIDIKGKMHDSPLSEEGVKQIKELATKLGEKPDLVLCSPFLRTRQTWNILKEELKLECNCIIDKEVGEFLGNQKYTSVLEETLAYDIYDHTETLNDLEKRTLEHAEFLYDQKARGVETIWIISHGFTISKLVENILRITPEGKEFYPKEGEMILVTI